MSQEQQSATLSSSLAPARWPWRVLLVALPFIFITRIPFADSELAWTGARLVIAACVVLLFRKVSLMASTSLGRTALRLYLTCVSLILIWFALNSIRYLTHDDAVEGRTTLAVRMYWFVTERAQPAMLYCIAATAILCLITAVIAQFKYNANTPQALKARHIETPE
jgi:hypothetical protein